MEVFIQKPTLDLYPGIRVTKDTAIDYENDNVKQTVRDLVFHSVTKVTGEGYESVYDTTIHLNEGDVLVFEDEGRGYIKPVAPFVTVAEAISDLECIREVGE